MTTPRDPAASAGRQRGALRGRTHLLVGEAAATPHVDMPPCVALCYCAVRRAARAVSCLQRPWAKSHFTVALQFEILIRMTRCDEFDRPSIP